MSEEFNFNTVVSPDVEFKGTIRTDKPLQIQGKVDGNIESEGEVEVAEGGILNGSVSASELSVKGFLEAKTNLEVLEVLETGKCRLKKQDIPPVLRLHYNCNLEKCRLIS